jgi:hypothetical protein
LYEAANVSGNKELRGALPRGYTLRPAHKHMLVEDPDGELVRHPDGRPLCVSKGGKPNSVTLRQILRLIERMT